MSLLLASSGVVSSGWFHDLSPFVYRISGDFGIRWYGVSNLLALVIAYFLLRWLSIRGVTPIPRDRVPDAMMLLVGGVIVGGRLGYILLYDPSLLIHFDSSPPWWGALALTKGGMSSHGGFLGVIGACFLIARGFKDEQGNRVGVCPPLHVMDICAMIAPLGLMLGRLANFVNGELLGKVVANPGQPAPWYGVPYPQEILERPLDSLPQTPEQMTAILNLSQENMLPGESDWELGYMRVLDMIRGGNEQIQSQLEPLISARYPTQLMQAFFDGFLVFVIVWFIARKPRRIGVIGPVMLIVYALGRIPMDFFRLPDSEIAQFGVLTRGQGYSLAMLALGVVVLILSHRKRWVIMGGWAVDRSAVDSRGSGLASQSGDPEGHPKPENDDSE